MILRGWRRLIAIGGLGTALLLCLPASVLAHAVLVEASPAQHEELTEPPNQIRLLFNEAVTADFNPIAVYDFRGQRVDGGNGRVMQGNVRLVVADLPDLPDGLYSVTYRVTSADGHLVSDTFVFTIGVPAREAGTDEERTVPRTPPAVSITHGMVQAAALAVAGLAGFYALIWRPGLRGQYRSLLPSHGRRISTWLWALGGLFVVSGLAELIIYTIRASGESLSAGLVWQGLMHTRVGRFFWARSGLGLLTAGIGALAAFMDVRPRTDRRAMAGTVLWALAGVVGLFIFVPLAGQSHAAATGRPLPVWADWLHMAGIAPWVGGVLGFVVLYAGTAAARASVSELVPTIVPRFSKLAVTSVAIMGLTGVYAALQYVPDWPALVTTGYGRTLLLKLGLLVPVLGLGAVNFFRRGGGSFRRLIAWELVLIIAIVGVTGFLSSRPPAEAEAGLTAGPFTATQAVEGVEITIHIDPAKYGYNQAFITLADGAGQPVVDASVGLRLSMPGHDMGPQNPEAVETEPGQYFVKQVVFGMGGPWDVEVAIMTARGRELRTTFRLRVPSPL